jgi:hypothetical protein
MEEVPDKKPNDLSKKKPIELSTLIERSQKKCPRKSDVRKQIEVEVKCKIDGKFEIVDHDRLNQICLLRKPKMIQFTKCQKI